MPVEVYEESVQKSIGVVEAVAFDGGRNPAYPYLPLKLSGRREQRNFPCAIIENEFLKVAVAPTLGGRVLSLLHKPSGLDPLAGDLIPRAVGRRGVELQAGLEFILGDGARANSMGSILVQPADPDLAEGVHAFELSEDGLSCQATYSLSPESECLQVELKVFNRSWRAVASNPGLRIALRGGTLLGGMLWCGDGCSLGFESDDFDEIKFDSGLLVATRFSSASKPFIAPRQTFVIRCRIHIIAIPGSPTLFSDGLLASQNGSSLCVAATRNFEGKVVLLAGAGGTLEAPLAAGPGLPATFDLSDVTGGVSSVAILGADGAVHKTDLREPFEPVSRWSRPHDGLDPELVHTPLPPSVHPGLPGTTVRRLVDRVDLRAQAHTVLGVQACSRADFEEAAEHLEAALMYAADDSLAWWLRAVALRLAGLADLERPELLNAHFISPLEPALRAEAFLSQPQSQGVAKNPLLDPLEHQPEAFLEVACLLIEAGLHQEAHRWLDEAVRHVDLPLLRILMAYLLARFSRMDAESAVQLKAFEELPDGPPYAARAVEREALAWLASKFEDNLRLKRLNDLALANG